MLLRRSPAAQSSAPEGSRRRRSTHGRRATAPSSRPVWAALTTVFPHRPDGEIGAEAPTTAPRVDARRQAGSFPKRSCPSSRPRGTSSRSETISICVRDPAAARLGAQLVVVRASTAFRASGGVRARRLGLAAAARLLEVPSYRFRALERLARARKLGLGRGGAALEVRLRRAPPRLRALVRLLDRQELLDELRHAPLLGGAQVGERAALGDGGGGGSAREAATTLARAAMRFRSVGSRVDRVTLMDGARARFSLFYLKLGHQPESLCPCRTRGAAILGRFELAPATSKQLIQASDGLLSGLKRSKTKGAATAC